MGNVTLPTPVFIAGGALFLVAGYLVGTVAGPDTPQRTSATVVSFETSTSTLCLSGDSVKDEDAADDQGVLCGTWSHSVDATKPRKGDRFRFVVLDSSARSGRHSTSDTVLYGTVER